MFEQPTLTIFSIPKPFVGEDAIRQRNAIGSWRRWIPGCEIFLFGDAPGTLQAANEFAAIHVPTVRCNEFGTPLVGDAFSQAAALGRGRILMYANADMIFRNDFATAVDRLLQSAEKPFLAIGRRIDVEVDRWIDWTNTQDVNWFQNAANIGRPASIMCKDFFVFPRGWYINVPPFVVGRGNWDNWIVVAAKRMGLRVIDLSASVAAIHQTHNHDHVRGGKGNAYVHGPEAKYNQRLGGGRHWIRGSTANWTLTSKGIERRGWFTQQFSFWADVPRAVRLAREFGTIR